MTEFTIGDVLEDLNSELYRLVEVGDDAVTVENLRTGKEYEWSIDEARDMASVGRVRSVTGATVTDTDQLDEDGTYRFEHAEPDDPNRTFRVDLRFADAEDFAGYGEGAISFHYHDGYISDVPVSNVERMIQAHKIHRVE